MLEGAINGSSLVGNLREAKPRRFAQLVVLSLVVHLLLTPVAALLGVASWLRLDSPEALPPPEPITAIPIEIFEELDSDNGEATPPPEPDTTVVSEPPKIEAAPPSVKELTKEPVESEPEKPEPETEKTKPEPEKAKPESQGDAGLPKEPEDEASEATDEKTEKPEDESKIADPTALVGAAAKVVKTESNVQLLIYNQFVREHQLGERIGKVLAILPQWNSFFGPAGIDPIRDLDAILVSGPQFRTSADVFAILGHQMGQPKMVQAVDALVHRGPQKGRWIRRGRRPAARAWADRAERVFALPNGETIIVAPPTAEQAVLDLGESVRLPEPKGQAAVIATIKTPWRALIGTDLKIPQSLTVARLEVSPVGKDAVRVRLIAEDATPELAKEHARELSVLINTLASGGGFASFLFGEAFVDHVELRAKGKEIHGETLIRPSQLNRLLNFVESWIQAYTGRVVRAAPSASVGKQPTRRAPTPSPRQTAAPPANASSGPTPPTAPAAPVPPTPPAGSSTAPLSEAP